MKSIFDLEDMSDLPETMRPRETPPGRWERLLREAGGPISITQFRAAAYRKYGKVFRSEVASATLRTLTERGKARRVAYGVYVHLDNDRQGLRAAV